MENSNKQIRVSISLGSGEAGLKRHELWRAAARRTLYKDMPFTSWIRSVIDAEVERTLAPAPQRRSHR